MAASRLPVTDRREDVFVATLTQNGNTTRFSRIAYNGRRTLVVDVRHCATPAQAVRTAQRRYPGWTCVVIERVSA